MDNRTERKAAPETVGDDFVRMYPSNQLKAQVRDPKETLSAFKVLKDTFLQDN